MHSPAIDEAPSARSTSVSHGARLTFETLSEAPSWVRVRPLEDTLLRVIDGDVRVTIGTEYLVLDVGDETIIPAGIGHRLSSPCGTACVVMGFRRGSR